MVRSGMVGTSVVILVSYLSLSFLVTLVVPLHPSYWATFVQLCNDALSSSVDPPISLAMPIYPSPCILFFSPLSSPLSSPHPVIPSHTHFLPAHNLLMYFRHRSHRNPNFPRAVRAHAPLPATHHRRCARAGVYSSSRPHCHSCWVRRRPLLVVTRKRSCCNASCGGWDTKLADRTISAIVLMFICPLMIYALI